MPDFWLFIGLAVVVMLAADNVAKQIRQSSEDVIRSIGKLEDELEAIRWKVDEIAQNTDRPTDLSEYDL